MTQAFPFRLKAAGLPLLPVWVAWNPIPTDAPGAIDGL